MTSHGFEVAVRTVLIGAGATLMVLQPTPVFNSCKSLITHTVFGVGPFVAARATAWLITIDP